MQYVGYGFQFWARTGSNLGIGAVWLDGVQIGTLDFYSATSQKASALITYPSVPYGTHRVKLTSTGTQNAAANGPNLLWDSLRVMR